MRKKNSCGALCEAGEGPRGKGTPREPGLTQNRAGAREQGHPTHRERERKGSGWKSGDVSDGDVSDGDVTSDVTSHTMVSTITTTNRMVITVYHDQPVALYNPLFLRSVPLQVAEDLPTSDRDGWMARRQRLKKFSYTQQGGGWLSLALVRRPSKYGIENICPPSLLPDRNDSQRPST